MMVLALTKVVGVIGRRRVGRDVSATRVEARAIAKPVARYVSRRVIMLGDVRAAADFTEGVYALAHYVERVAGWEVTDDELARASADFDELHPEPAPPEPAGPASSAGNGDGPARGTSPRSSRPRRARATTAPPDAAAAEPPSPPEPAAPVPATSPAGVLGEVDQR